MKIGRNEPCPCGSGKKYKKCCMNRSSVSSPEFHYRRLSQVYNRLLERLLDHATRVFGESVLHVAMDEFLVWPESEDAFSDEQLSRIEPLFWPWLAFNWEYDSEDAEVELPGPENRTVAELYAEARGARLDPLERCLIESINRKPYSFWEVVSVVKGQRMTLRDCLTGQSLEVQDRSGSECVQASDVIFGRAVSVDGVGMLAGVGATVIPPGRKPDIIDLRQRLQEGCGAIDDDDLYDWDAELRHFFFQLEQLLYERPQLCDSEGHPLEFHRLVYEISSADAAFEKLCGLCRSRTAEDLAAEAERDDAGRIVHVEIPWDRPASGLSPGVFFTILGRLVIDGHRLVAEVRSAERAEALRREIDARLGSVGRYKVTEIQSLESLLGREPSASADEKAAKEQEELMAHPEIQARMAELIGKHWEGWIDERIPALGGKTPREAVKTAAGREAVEALLEDIGRDRGQDPFIAEANRRGIRRVKERLGLTER